MDVIWGIKAKHSYFDELERIHTFHTVKEVEKFIHLVERVILNLRTETPITNPFTFAVSA